jgi:hypothetical protein
MRGVKKVKKESAHKKKVHSKKYIIVKNASGRNRVIMEVYTLNPKTKTVERVYYVRGLPGSPTAVSIKNSLQIMLKSIINIILTDMLESLLLAHTNLPDQCQLINLLLPDQCQLINLPPCIRKFVHF